MVVRDVGVDGDGKRKQARRRGFRTKREAQDALTALRADVQRGEYVKPTKQTVAEFIDEWPPAIRTTVEPSTLESCDRMLRSHVRPRIGGIRLRQLDAGRLNGLYADFLEHGRLKGKGGLSARTRPVLVLRAWRKVQAEQRLAMGAGWQDVDGFLFTEPDGTARDPESAAKVFERRAAKSGLPRIRFHDLRHTHAVHLIAAGSTSRSSASVSGTPPRRSRWTDTGTSCPACRAMQQAP